MKIKLLVISMILLVLTISFLWIYNGIENKKVIKTDTEISILLSQHPYVEAIVSELDAFSQETGINVVYNIVPEDDYYRVLTTRMSQGYEEPDVVMIGPYFLWELSHREMLENLTPYYSDLSSDYNIDDILPNVLEMYTVSEDTENTKTYGLPLGFEVAVLAYNRRIFDELNLEVPKTYDQLLEVCRKIDASDSEDLYALAVRGNDDWAMLNTSYITMFANYMKAEGKDGDLTQQLSSGASYEMNRMWLDIVHAGKSPDWDRSTWGVASADFGSGRAAMLFDMDNVAYYQNIPGESTEAGNLAWTTIPTIREGDDFVANMWSWGLSMNADSRSKDAAWKFIEYYTSEAFLRQATRDYKLILPPRKSVMESNMFRAIIGANPGYQATLDATIPKARVLLRPQYNTINILEAWSKTVKGMEKDDGDMQGLLNGLQEEIDGITR